ncbi:MAG: sensor histidine kinase, partial [Candidatus Izemoplasmataceae bacterium]
LAIKFEKEAVDDIITEAVKRTKKLTVNRKLISKLPHSLIIVEVDIHLMTQVLINLIENAVNHTSDHGKIVISTEIESNKIRFNVEDDGTGVSALDKPHIFEMFYTNKHDGARGIGLGLSICKSIIEAHNGTISVSDSQYNGAKFSFTLPIGEVITNE